jgi:hypothetical protein
VLVVSLCLLGMLVALPDDYWGMVFGDIVAIVFFFRCPVVSEFALIFSISKPVVFHVHRL